MMKTEKSLRQPFNEVWGSLRVASGRLDIESADLIVSLKKFKDGKEIYRFSAMTNA